MPFPAHAVTVSGGCNCGAVRYRISVPELSERPLHPHSSPEDPVYFPFVCTDHCNDCRRASASILPAWLCTPMATASASVAFRNSSSPAAPADATLATIDVATDKRKPHEGSTAGDKEKEGPRNGGSGGSGGSSGDSGNRSLWLPAAQVFAPGPELERSFLTFYESSPGKRRFFCARCGTNLAFVPVSHYLAGYPAVFDVLLGSVDRADLETDALRPDRELWWDYGVPWIRRLCSEGSGLPRHPVYKVNECVKS